MVPVQLEPPHCAYAPAEPPAEPLDEGEGGVDVGAAALVVDGAGVSVVLLPGADALVLGLELAALAALAPAAGVVVAAAVVVAEADPVTDPVADPVAEPPPAATAEPVEVTAEVAWVMDEAPLYRVGPGTW